MSVPFWSYYQCKIYTTFLNEYALLVFAVQPGQPAWFFSSFGALCSPGLG